MSPKWRRPNSLSPRGPKPITPSRSDQSADGADHRENASDIALIESMDGNACADECCRDLPLEIGEGEDEIGLEREDLRNIGRGEGRNARLLAPDLRRPHGIT